MPRVGTSPAVDSKEAGAGGAPGAATQCPWERLGPQELRALPASSGCVSGPFLDLLPMGPQARPPPCSWAALSLAMLLLQAVGERGPASQLQTSSLLTKPSQQAW